MEVPEPTSAIRDVIVALRPISLWFGTVTAVTALVVWTYSNHAWSAWPWPLQALVVGWLFVAALTPIYILVDQFRLLLYNLLERRVPDSDDDSPTPRLRQATLPLEEADGDETG